MTKILGLTGGIGSGKSSVAQFFQELGAKIVDADQLARKAVAIGSPGLALIKGKFGAEVLLESGGLDRKAMGTIVFGDEKARESLSAIVHPEVQRLSAEAMQTHIAEGAGLILYDVPLLYENGLDKMMAEVIVVHVPPKIQRQRIRARDNLDEAEIEARIAAQDDLDEKAKKADYLIDNQGTREDTRRQVEALWAKLTENK